MNREEMQTELDTLKRRIAELEAQMNEPEWHPFAGEIVEVSDFGHDWIVRQITAYNPGDDFPYKTGKGTDWKYARPLSDPNIIQLRPHTPGDPMPCDGHVRVIAHYGDLDVDNYVIGQACSRNWKDVTAWAPLP